MQIEIVNVTVTAVPTAKGSYQRADTIYKNLSYQGKVEQKPVMDFVDKAVFASIKNSQPGDVFTVTREKDDKGFWKWTKLSPGVAGEEKEAAVVETKPNVAPKGNWETVEERAKKQTYIIRQSSLGHAVALLASNGGKKNTVEETIQVARQFEAYVTDATVNFCHDLEEDVPL